MTEYFTLAQDSKQKFYSDGPFASYPEALESLVAQVESVPGGMTTTHVLLNLSTIESTDAVELETLLLHDPVLRVFYELGRRYGQCEKTNDEFICPVCEHPETMHSIRGCLDRSLTGLIDQCPCKLTRTAVRALVGEGLIRAQVKLATTPVPMTAEAIAEVIQVPLSEPETLTCQDCGQPLIIIEPQLDYDKRFGHTTREDARDCNRPPSRQWPLPKEES